MTGKIFESSVTTANVTVGGLLGNIEVYNIPINFTVDVGLQPLTNYNPKQREPEGIGFITVKLNSSNNANYNVYMNATALQLLGDGISIPVTNLYVNSTCNGTQSSPSLVQLSNSLQAICEGSYEIYRYNSTNIYFYLNIPAGQNNGTYFGDVWIYINSSQAPGQNHTWYGYNNTTTTVKVYIEFSWNSTNTPINFGTLSPGSRSNATKTPSPKGFPASVISGTGTNVYIDVYVNGTDLTTSGTPTYTLGCGNITYSNATSELQWPSNLKTFNKTFPASSTGGDFTNWGHVGNASNVYSFWNITIPGIQPPGDYGGIVNAKATEEGESP